MKKSEKRALGEAQKFELLQALRVDGFVTKELFTVAGKPGLYRRVGRSSQGITRKRPGAELVLWEGGVIELVRDVEAEKELAEAGFGVPALPEVGEIEGKDEAQAQDETGRPDQQKLPLDEFPPLAVNSLTPETSAESDAPQRQEDSSQAESEPEVKTHRRGRKAAQPAE